MVGVSVDILIDNPGHLPALIAPDYDVTTHAGRGPPNGGLLLFGQMQNRVLALQRPTWAVDVARSMLRAPHGFWKLLGLELEGAFGSAVVYNRFVISF